MRVERDIAGFAIPFSIGILLTMQAGPAFYDHAGIIHLISLTFCATAIWTLSRGQLDSDAWIRAVTAAAACSCGILTVLVHTAFPYDSGASAFETYAVSFGTGMQETIDTIVFKSDRTGAIIKALLTGERSSLPTDVTEAFRDSGASHILALSGLHLGIIYGLITRALSVFGNSPARKRLRSLTAIMSCGFYTMATGAGDSITRAFIFIVLGEVSRYTGRSRSLGQILFASLIIQLTFDPMSICSIGFQLSYAAITGIAFIYPRLRTFWPKEDRKSRSAKHIWESAALSISCQLTTGPLAYLYFGTFPRHFLLTNLISLPLTGAIIPCALLTMILSVPGCCPPFLISLTEWLVALLTWSLEVISTM